MSCCICVRPEGGEQAAENGREERRPLLQRQNDVHERFRLGRDEENSKSKQVMGCVVKWSANSIGIWEPHGCCFILSVFFALVCTYQLIYDLMTVIGCHGFDCGFLKKEQSQEKIIHPNSSQKPYRKTANTVYTLASIGGCLSYILLFYCLSRMKCKRDNALAPSKTLLRDLSHTQVAFLLVCLVVTGLLFLVGVSLFYYIVRNQPRGLFFDEMTSGVGCQFVAQWCAIVACTVFSVSSSGLGTFSDYTFRRLLNMGPEDGLDRAITIHEELCSVVCDTVSAYGLWFVFHWLLYGSTCILSIVYVAEEIAFGSAWTNLLYIGIFVVIHFFLFLSPCCCAAYITATCGGLHSRVNKTLSTDWPENHLFRERNNLALFTSYVKDRQCGFKIGRITFTSTLAWFSLLLGTTGLIFHFF